MNNSLRFLVLLCLTIQCCQSDSKPTVAVQEEKKLPREEKATFVPDKAELPQEVDLPEAEPPSDEGKIVNKMELDMIVSISNISFEGLHFHDTKKRMMATMGKPDRIERPHYGCGPHSEDSQGIAFYQFFYGNMNFIVYEETAEIESILFVDSETLNVKGEALSSKMNFETVVAKLGLDMDPEKYYDDYIVLYLKEYIDERIYLTFKDNHLYQFETYAPC